MTVVTAVFPVTPEHPDDGPRLARSSTPATRDAEGSLWSDRSGPGEMAVRG